MSISADAVYSQTLQSIIDAKLNELVKKSEVYESSKNQVLKAVEGESNKVQQIQLLLDGIRRCFQIQKDDDGVVNTADRRAKGVAGLLDNVERFLEQPRYDSSVSDALLDHWKSSLMHELRAQDSRFEYASLYARLVTDWLSSEGNPKARLPAGDVEMEDSFEELESSARLESRLKWQAVAFNPLDTNTTGIHNFLDRLFGKGRLDQKQLLKALATIKESVSAFETTLTLPGQFNESVIRWCIKGIIGSRRLGDKKLKVLQDFQNNTVILSELADVLNLRMANIDEWSWGDQLQAQQNRRLAGYYDVEMDEDLLQAVFLQYIGTRWAVFFRKSLADCVDTDGVWRSSQQAASTEDHQRRRYYTGSQFTKHSLNAERYRLWRSKYFLTQLPKIEWQVVLSEDGDEEADYKSSGGKAPRKQLASKAARKSAPSTGPIQVVRRSGSGRAKRHRKAMRYDEEDFEVDEDGNSVYSSDTDDVDENNGDTDYETRKMMDLKQGLMRLFQTETLFSLRLHGKAAAFRGQFDHWDDMLSHSTILEVLSFFGLSQRWLKFMNAFLKPKLQFTQDGETGPARTRQRGVPKSHPLSDMMGEIILFCMDLLINQECDGAILWRQYNDFWFWSNDVKLCAKAWASIEKFSKAFGFELDEEKAGSMSIDRTQPKQSAKIALGLPRNAIRWGFLYFDAASGEFEIDQTLVSNHIKELKHQLSEKDRKGIFSWIQAWNTYAITFFSTNFGKPAYCFGSNHIKKVLQALEKMQEEVFNDLNMITHITKTISDKYDVTNIPEGFVFFPTDLGGLELRNPFIRPIQLSKALLDNEPADRFKQWENHERETFEHAKKTFEKRVAIGNLPTIGLARRGNYTPPGAEKHKFFSFEEYTRYREEYDFTLIPSEYGLGRIFLDLLEEPRENRIELSHDIQNAIKHSSVAPSDSNVRAYGLIQPYWSWILQVYGPEIIRKFGGLNIVDAGVLPIGMLSLVRASKVEWK